MNKLRKVYENEYFPFVCIFVLYIAMFSFMPMLGDDASLVNEYAGLTLKDHWDLIVYDWEFWSSRVIVNFFIHFLLGKNKLVFTILNAFICAALCYSFSKLFVKTDKRICNWFIVCFVLLFPIKYFGSAGWMVTSMTYFWPIAMGFVSLIPIRKILDDEKISVWESILYSFALVYSANEELMLVILFSVYCVFLIYFMKNKKIRKYYMIQIILLIASIIMLIICPGNHARSDTESIYRFRNFGMLNIFDKIDIGFSSTMQQVLFGKELFFIVVCAVLFLIVWKKYDDWFYRLIAFMPVLFTTAIGPFKDFVNNLFPGLNYISWSVDVDGLFSLTSADIPSIMKFMLYCFIALCFMISIFLCFEKDEKTLFSLTLLISGTASRVAMGLSPTIYASGFRTATPMYMGILGIGIMGVSYMKEKKLFSKKEEDILILILLGITILKAIHNLIEIYYY